MASPVERISGPSTGSTPEKRTRGRPPHVPEMCGGQTSWVMPWALRVTPIMTLVATLAQGMPVTLLTKGTVRLAARG